jgi:PAS domain S-box-containing protein
LDRREEERDVVADRSVMISLVDCTLIIERDGLIRSIDGRVTEVLGYDAAVVPGHYVWEVVHPDDVQRAVETIERHLSMPGFKEPTFIVRCRHLDGTWRRFEVPARTLDDGAIMLGLRQLAFDDPSAPDADIVNLVALAGLEARYDLLFVADQNAVITMIEERVNDELGYRPRDVIGRGMWEFVHPDDVAAAADAFDGELAFDDYRGPTKVIRLRRADLGWRRCEIHGRNRLADPQLRGVVVGLRFMGPGTTQRAPGRVPAALWEQLTRAERDVVTAVSAGLSNKEIAVSQLKSIRTVESQLRSIYRKLGLTSRSELVAEVLTR